MDLMVGGAWKSVDGRDILIRSGIIEGGATRPQLNDGLWPSPLPPLIEYISEFATVHDCHNARVSTVKIEHFILIQWSVKRGICIHKV
jgi:hypothetical protein